MYKYMCRGYECPCVLRPKVDIQSHPLPSYFLRQSLSMKPRAGLHVYCHEPACSQNPASLPTGTQIISRLPYPAGVYLGSGDLNFSPPWTASCLSAELHSKPWKIYFKKPGLAFLSQSHNSPWSPSSLSCIPTHLELRRTVNFSLVPFYTQHRHPALLS